jgi:phosphoribosylamine--glycine ligase
MNVLLLGSGGREHALATCLARSPKLGRLLIAPGNPGTATVGRNVPLDPRDAATVLDLARQDSIDLVVIGPEAPLVEGLVDHLAAQGIAAFGPVQAAAQLEGSKSFTKDFCRALSIPTAAYAVFTDAAAAKAHLDGLAFPQVIKADGLAAGKGVVIAASRAEAEEALDFMLGGGFGGAGSRVVIEDFLEGVEISFFALCDGTRAVPFASAQDHKRLGEGDTGPNTGGMGAISPAPAMTPAIEDAIMRRIIEPTLAGMRARGTPFKGVLFAGLMLTREGPKLIEFNVRFGDPETQAMVLRLGEDLLPWLEAAAAGRLPDRPLVLGNEVSVAVVLAAQGYPEAPIKGGVIEGLELAAGLPAVSVFQAGTRRSEDGPLLADGGRVLTIAAVGRDLAEARARAYGAVDAIRWREGFCRRDIGLRALGGEGQSGSVRAFSG